jgi:Putative porin
MKHRPGKMTQLSSAGIAAMLAVYASTTGFCAEPPDPLLDLFIKKGFVTEQEAEKVKAEADAIRAANSREAALPPLGDSKWKISKAIRNVELFGDVRLRYEQREAKTPGGEHIELDRGRYAVRLGLRGDAFDDFYYGLRMDTGSNPRSPWITFATSSSGVPYQGPFGKSTAGINVGQIYIGWHPTAWLDITLGKMPNPLYTTPMIWDSDLNPEGAAERFKYTVGAAELFATFGQFLYQDTNPNSASGGLGVGINSLTGQKTDNVFLIAWQAGVNYHVTTNVSAKVAAGIYEYLGLTKNTPPFYGDPYVGEGAFLGPGTGTLDGGSGWNPNAGATTPGFFAGFPNNQTGLNHLLVLEVPFEVNFKISQLDARVFGDVAYNLEGRRRAEEAAAAYGTYLSANSATISGFSPQRGEVKAYQIGFALGNRGSLGLVSGSALRRHGWEVRAYWQHVEQYAVDPNMLDSDFFEGRANLEGLYGAIAYGFGENVIGTVRYGTATRINKKLGTGGVNQDIPQINPVDRYNLLQLDLTLRF